MHADLVAIIHAILILTYMVGGVAVATGRFARRWPLHWIEWLYLMVAVSMCLAHTVLRRCPLTVLEQWLRGDGDTRDFVARHCLGMDAAVVDWAMLAATAAALVGSLQTARRGLAELRRRNEGHDVARTHHRTS